jgi:hypothetical protein
LGGFEVEEGRFGRETAVELPPFCSHGSFRGIVVKQPTRYCQSSYNTNHAIDYLSSQRVDVDFLSKSHAADSTTMQDPSRRSS